MHQHPEYNSISSTIEQLPLSNAASIISSYTEQIDKAALTDKVAGSVLTPGCDSKPQNKQKRQLVLMTAQSENTKQTLQRLQCHSESPKNNVEDDS